MYRWLEPPHPLHCHHHPSTPTLPTLALLGWGGTGVCVYVHAHTRTHTFCIDFLAKGSSHRSCTGDPPGGRRAPADCTAAVDVRWFMELLKVGRLWCRPKRTVKSSAYFNFILKPTATLVKDNVSTRCLHTECRHMTDKTWSCHLEVSSNENSFSF